MQQIGSGSRGDVVVATRLLVHWEKSGWGKWVLSRYGRKSAIDPHFIGDAAGKDGKGCPGQSLGLFLEMRGHLVAGPMGPYGTLRASMEPHMSLWAPTELYGMLWAALDSYTSV